MKSSGPQHCGSEEIVEKDSTVKKLLAKL